MLKACFASMCSDVHKLYRLLTETVQYCTELCRSAHLPAMTSAMCTYAHMPAKQAKNMPEVSAKLEGHMKVILSFGNMCPTVG